MDDLTRRSLAHWAKRTARPDPEAQELWRLANDPASDDESRLAALEQIYDLVDQRQAEEAGTPAQVAETPGLPLFVPYVPSGLSPAEAGRVKARQWAAIRRHWAEILAKSLATHDPAERRSLASIVDRPPPGWSRNDWTPDTAKRWLAYRGLSVALALANEPWSGRIGSGKGSGRVPPKGGTIVPRDQSVLGGQVWLEQEALKYARDALSDIAAEYEDPRRSDLRPPEEVDWPSDPESGRLMKVDGALIAEERQPDTALLLPEALLLSSPQQRQILMARWDPGQACAMEDAAKASGRPLTDEDRDLLDAECDTWADVARLLRLSSPAQVRQQVQRLRKKLD